MGTIFETYVERRTELPVAETLGKLGFELRGQPYAADVFLIEKRPADPAAIALRRSMFGF